MITDEQLQAADAAEKKFNDEIRKFAKNAIIDMQADWDAMSEEEKKIMVKNIAECDSQDPKWQDGRRSNSGYASNDNVNLFTDV